MESAPAEHYLLGGQRELSMQVRQGAETETEGLHDLRIRETDSALSHSSSADRSTPYVWYVIFLLFVVNLFNYLDRMALAMLAPLIKADLNLSDAQLGLLTGFAFALFYAFCGIPLARWADRGIRRNIVAICVATWSVMTALSGAAQNFWHLLVARVGVATSEAGCFPTASSLICDYVPLKRRSGVFAITTFGVYAGMMLGMMLGGWLGETVGWRWTFVVLGLPGIALAIVVKLTLREPTRGSFDDVKDNNRSVMSLGETIGILWRCRTYRRLVAFMVLNGFVQYGLTQWWPSLYSRVFGLSLSSVGAYLGIALGAGSGIGLLIGGLMANKAARRDVRLPLVIGAIATALAIPAALGSLFVSSTRGSILLVSLATLLWSVSNGPVAASKASVVTSRMRAMGAGIAIFATSVLGFGLGPFCVGLLSDIMTPSLGVEALRYALLAPICFLPLMVVVLYRAAKSLPNDLRMIGTKVEDGPSARAVPNGNRSGSPVAAALLREPGKR